MSRHNTTQIAPANQGDFLVYESKDGQLKIDVRFQDETVWLSLNQLAQLFQRDKSVISRHIKNVFDEGELTPDETVAKSATVQYSQALHESTTKADSAPFIAFMPRMSLKSVTTSAPPSRSLRTLARNVRIRYAVCHAACHFF